MSRFAQNLKALRLERGLTQAALARRAGLASTAISMYELGQRQPDLDRLERLAQALNAPASALLASAPPRTASLRISRPPLRPTPTRLPWPPCPPSVRGKGNRVPPFWPRRKPLYCGIIAPWTSRPARTCANTFARQSVPLRLKSGFPAPLAARAAIP